MMAMHGKLSRIGRGPRRRPPMPKKSASAGYITPDTVPTLGPDLSRPRAPLESIVAEVRASVAKGQEFRVSVQLCRSISKADLQALMSVMAMHYKYRYARRIEEDYVFSNNPALGTSTTDTKAVPGWPATWNPTSKEWTQ